MLDQISTIRSIESDLALGDRLDSIVTENQLTSAAGMIGKFVSGYAEGWGNVTGFVVAALRQGDSVAIELDTGWIVPLQNVEVVLEPESIPDGPVVPEEPDEPTDPESPENPTGGLGNSDTSAQPLPPQVGPGAPPELG